MNNLKVALMQLLPEDNLSGNLDKGIEYCKRAKQMGADIALFRKCGLVVILYLEIMISLITWQ